MSASIARPSKPRGGGAARARSRASRGCGRFRARARGSPRGSGAGSPWLPRPRARARPSRARRARSRRRAAACAAPARAPTSSSPRVTALRMSSCVRASSARRSRDLGLELVAHVQDPRDGLLQLAVAGARARRWPARRRRAGSAPRVRASSCCAPPRSSPHRRARSPGSSGSWRSPLAVSPTGSSPRPRRPSSRIFCCRLWRTMPIASAVRDTLPPFARSARSRYARSKPSTARASPRRRARRGGAACGAPARRRAAGPRRSISSPDASTAALLDHVAQLAHVARPGVARERGQRLGRRAASSRARAARPAARESARASAGMSSGRSRSGGSSISTTLQAVVEVLAEAPARDLVLRGRGAWRRPRARRPRSASRRRRARSSRSCSTRSTLACVSGGMSPISSRKIVPPSAPRSGRRGARRRR